MQIKPQTRILEISAVLMTGIGKFIFMDWLDLKLPFIIFACTCWTLYVIFKYINSPEILDYWGISSNNFKTTFIELLSYAIILISAFIGIGYWFDLSVLNLSIIPIIIVYPVWGIIQQFIIIALLAKNLKEYEQIKLSNHIIVFITAFVFSIVHYPFPYLMIGTFFLAIVYTYLYLNRRNLLVLGIFHGWLGAFFYYCILGRDTFSEVFSKLN